MISTLFSFFLLVLCSFQLMASELGELNSTQLETLQTQHNALLIDIRTPQEWAKTGIIPHSYPVTFFDSEGQYDLKKWMAEIKKLQKKPEQPIVLVCRTGNRSAKLGKLLTQELGMKNVYHLSNGIISWMIDDKTIQKYCPPHLACH